MSMDDGEVRYPGLYIGEVVDREDPEGIGRVRVRIPGLVEPASNWAFPLGTVGGGSDRRGFYSVPEKGAEVGVLFHQGDVDHPHYLCGHWGKPDGNAEVPEPVRDLSKEDAPKVRAFETERFLLVFDDRSGSEKLLLKDKATEDLILIEAATGIRIKTAKDVTVEVEGNVVLTAKGDASIDVDGDVSVTAGGSAKVDAGTEAVVSAPDVQLGSSGLSPPVNGLVLGGGIDTFTGLTYAALQNASAVVKAKK